MADKKEARKGKRKAKRGSPGASTSWSMKAGGVRKLAKARLNRVVAQSELTGKEGPSVEEVHQLRVAIQRLRACFREFPDVFSRKGLEKVVPQLRRAFKLAGRTRDYDIALLQARGLGAHSNTKLVRTLKALRHESALALRENLETLSPQHWAKDLGLKKGGTARGGVEVQPRSFPLLNRSTPMVTRTALKLGRKVAEGNGSLRQLHKFRLSLKKCRYLLELYEGNKDNDVAASIHTLKSLQDGLGDINDYRTTIDLLRTDPIAGFPRVPELTTKLQDLKERRAETFRATWRADLKNWG